MWRRACCWRMKWDWEEIEACLVIHRLLSTGRASRVLVVVPESLVHQWFVELLRRFNLWFHLFDEERCDAVEAAEPGCNPFLEDQWVLCGLPLLLDPKRSAQAVEAGWTCWLLTKPITSAGPPWMLGPNTVWSRRSAGERRDCCC